MDKNYTKNHTHGINSPLTKLSFSVFFFEINFEKFVFSFSYGKFTC